MGMGKYGVSHWMGVVMVVAVAMRQPGGEEAWQEVDVALTVGREEDMVRSR